MESDVESTPVQRLRAYLAAVDAGDFERAAMQFSPETSYATPPVHEGEVGPQVLHGRDALLDSLRERGHQAMRHEIVRAVTDPSGLLVFAEGRIHIPQSEEERIFLSRSTVDSEGLLLDYIVALV